MAKQKINKTPVTITVKPAADCNTRQAVSRAVKGKYWLPLTSALLLTSYTYALGLQEIQVNSNLGEPLSAMVYLSSVGNQTIRSDCFQATKGAANSDIPNLNDARVRLNRIGNQLALQISTTSAVREPLSEITIASNCASLPGIQRTYTLMLDPASISEERQAIANYAIYNNARRVENLNINTQPVSTTRQRRTAINNYGSPVKQGSQYTVQVGDTLSTIAARISDRPYGSVWSLAAAIHVNNTVAFTNNDPNLIELGSVINIPVIDGKLASNVKFANAAFGQASKTAATQELAVIDSTPEVAKLETVTQYLPATQEALPIMTLSTQLSMLSIERIRARASGQTVSAALIPNTGNLFGTDPGQQQTPETPQNAVLSNNPVLTRDPASLNVELPTINESASDKSSGSKFMQLISILGLLTLMGLASWKFLVPKLKQDARIRFIRAVRKHKDKQRFIQKGIERKAEISRTSLQPISIDSEIDSFVSNRAKPELSDEQSDAAEIRPAEEVINKVQAEEPELELEKDTSNDFTSKRSTGPRKATVAEEIYEVGMIDDTGELVSLTMAFPELEAELNARLGDDIPELGDDLDFATADATRQTKTMEYNPDEFSGLELEPPTSDQSSGETVTVKLESPISGHLDLELPGLSDEDASTLEADFETIAQDADLSKTMIFNDEVFVPGEALSDRMADTTQSTETLDADAETRVAPVLRDDDGLSPADFGLSDDDFPMDREDYGYLEPDASINTDALNLSQEELEELGLDGDDNIIPFAPSKRKKQA